MRFSTGLLIGFGAGYYLGSKAGRERYHQIEDVLESVRSTDGYRQLRAKVSDVVDVGSEKLGGVIDELADKTEARLDAMDAADSGLFSDPTLN